MPKNVPTDVDRPTGITVARHYTTEGVDPSSLFEFARRDARITHPDGSVVFEMRDIEVPADWGQTAVDVLASKYFRKAGVPQFDTAGNPLTHPDGTPVVGAERSARQWATRIAGAWRVWGERGGYFATPADAQAFADECTYVLLAQVASPNSPQHFNTGLFEAYGIVNDPNGEWYVDPATGETRESAHRYERVAANACFIQGVKDQLVGDGSIFDLMEREARLFQGGSGSGTNYSAIRGKGELLSGGGTASGVMSFIKVSDRAAGGIKSGGTTRRAAKMVLLDADHPEIEDFIWAKAHEERKIAALAAAGWDAAWNAEDGAVEAAFYQNFNASVMLPEGFMEAVRDDGDWHLTGRTTGGTVRTVKAREIWDAIAEAAWTCADPGVMFSDIINSWNTVRDADGDIVATNPCFTKDTLVHTDKGLVSFGEMLDRVRTGESFGIYTHDATNPDSPEDRIVLSSHDHVAVTGVNEINKLVFDNGLELRCTPDHRIWTSNRGYVQAQEITADDEVLALSLPTPFSASTYELPVPTDAEHYMSAAALQRSRRINLPQKWDADLGHYLGWLVGDGCLAADRDATITVYGEDGDVPALDRHHAFLAGVLGDVSVAEMGNGTRQLRTAVGAFHGFLRALGCSPDRAPAKRVPSTVFQAPTEAVAAFLQGLFDADGTVVDDHTSGTRYVGLSSSSRDLLVDAQRLLSTFGIFSRIYQTRQAGPSDLSYERVDGSSVRYDRAASFDLRISAQAIQVFASQIGFSLPHKAELLDHVVADHQFYDKGSAVRLVSREYDGVEVTYNLCEPRNHSYVANGVVVRNCAEFVFLNDTACNLASINLVKFWDDGARTFDHAAFEHVVRLFTVMLEITVSMSHYPSEVIARNSFEHRPLGLGFANLGALLMRAGLPYDSSEGRAAMSAISALMTLRGYTTSSELAAAVGPCISFERNRGSMTRVLRNHVRAAHGDRLADAAGGLFPIGDYEGLVSRPLGLVHADLAATPFASLSAPVLSAGDELLRGLDEHGVRNAQISVVAPTGTIGLQMGCDTTGVEPAFALVVGKKLAGGGYMKIVNDSVAPALHGLGYDDTQVAAIVAHALGTGTLDGPTPVNRAALLAAGLPAAGVANLEASLASSFDLAFAADPYVVGLEHLAAAGITADEATAPGFSLLARLGFSAADISASSKAICGHHTVEGAPHLHDEHLAVFDCANYCGDGDRTIHWSGHVRALGAVAPFVSGSISKTVNLPNDATASDIADAHTMAYELGVKNVAVYRDGSKGSQVLSSGSLKDTASELADEVALDVDALVAEAVEEALRATRVIDAGISPSQFYKDTTPPRFKLPTLSYGPEWRLNIGGQKVFLRGSEWEDGSLAEIWIEVAKEGSLTKGLASCLAISVSQGLQHGVPLSKFVDTFTFHTFAPNGVVQGHDNIKMANSLVDLVFRVLGFHYLGRTDLVQVKPEEGTVTAPDGASATLVGRGSAAAGPVAPLASGTSAEPAAVAVDQRNEPGPPCSSCGNATVRSGACHRCLACGASSGCS